MKGSEDLPSKDHYDTSPFGLSDLPSRGDYKLPQVSRGRMLCTSHGQVCYRRVSFTGEKEWVCPDERHRKPILDS
jgi:hypothetical protein